MAQTAGAPYKSGRGCLVCMACKDFCQGVKEGLNGWLSALMLLALTSGRGFVTVSKGLDALL